MGVPRTLGETRRDSVQPTTDPTLGVVIIEDMKDVREGLSVLINGTAGFRCTAAYRTMEDALSAVKPIGTDVILTDIGLPGMSGIDGIRALRQRLPGVPILALTVYDSDDQVFRALCAGASGYLLKNTPPVRLLESLREVAAGGAPMSPEVARRVLRLRPARAGQLSADAAGARAAEAARRRPP
jgi:DNA-binding NarL/FixJ family response regulator